MVKHSFRQLFRTPVRAVLFLLLLGAAVLLLSVGGGLFYISGRLQQEAEGSFTTMGTVRQKPSSTSLEKNWDLYQQDYGYFFRRIYDKVIPDTVLKDLDAAYTREPAHRPFYVACDESYIVRKLATDVDQDTTGLEMGNMIAEVTPWEDCTADHPVRLRVNRVLFGDWKEDVLKNIWFWDVTTPEPASFQAGQTYLMALSVDSGYLGRFLDMEDYPDVSVFWYPWMDIQGSQYQADGTEIPDEEHEDQYFSLVTEDFYQTAEGKRWLSLIEGFFILNYGIPVVPADGTELLPYFYQGQAGILEGRDITEEEYETGEAVCMVESVFAENNGLEPGDTLTLPLYFASYAHAPGYYYPRDISEYVGQTGYEKLIRADGTPYTCFFRQTYRIVGIWQSYGGDSMDRETSAPGNGVIIPAKSVTESQENNILDYGPMTHGNTSFCLENGTMDQFWEEWEKQGTDDLEIVIDDGGYSRIAQSFETSRKMAVALLVSGGVTALLIAVFFSHLFITRQKARMAVERSLGVTRRQCGVSLLAGLFLLAAAGCVLGAAAGKSVTKNVASALENPAGYSSLYSASKAEEEEEELPLAAKILEEGQWDILIPAGAGAAVAGITAAVSLAAACRSLKEEPLALLAEMERDS